MNFYSFIFHLDNVRLNEISINVSGSHESSASNVFVKSVLLTSLMFFLARHKKYVAKS